MQTVFTSDSMTFQAFSSWQNDVLPSPSPLRAAITAAYRRDEQEAVQWLLTQAQRDARLQLDAHRMARTLVEAVREKRTRASGVDALMHEFSLSSEEGVALMCLAEALLRIPDRQTADRLIADKIGKGDWRKHLGESPSLFVNAATWGLVVTGKLVTTTGEEGLSAALTRLIAKGGEPLIRKGVDIAMRMLGNQFVTGRTIEEALNNSREKEAQGYRYSYDMLGEAAMTAEDALKYYFAYDAAIHAIGKASNGRGIKQGPGISVKLSALHPRYSRAQHERVMQELLPRLKQLLLQAKKYDIGFNIDAEESDRLELSLDLIEALAFDPEFDGFAGLGFVVQAYQKRCPFVLDYLIDISRRSGRKLMVRLVKGAYWDSEIKRAQVDGMSGYPVYTRKVHTDVSYLVCAQKLLAASDTIYPQFATHNAYTLSMIYTWAKQLGVTDYEFQCLHGMGETLYDQVVGKDKFDRPCRIYAPVGSHETLLAYLVRRLLENGANSSFVNQIVDDKVSIDTLIADPFDTVERQGGGPHPHIPLPRYLYGTERLNSAGFDLSNEDVLRGMQTAFSRFGKMQWQAAPILATLTRTIRESVSVLNPADRRDIVGYVTEAQNEDVQQALAAAQDFALDWQTVEPSERAATLMRAANLFEDNALELMTLAVREAGKSVLNAIAEIREAVDFLRYYAMEVKYEPNTLALGPMVCISPWNFPLAIFIGEISAALAAGNVVLVKPAEQTPLIAYRAVQLLHEAGIPRAALQFLPGRGETVGAPLTADERVRGVIFTGSTEVAQSIHRTLAKRAINESHECVLVAETGGQNAMIVDSSALPEQVVQDVLMSAFDSAGQRCSALRVLCLQEDVADRILTMLKGAMQELRIGSPDRLNTDVGPVIDTEAQQGLLRHIEHMREIGKPVHQLPLPEECEHGSFVPPTVIEIASLAELRREVFGPVLHVLRYRREQLPQVVEAINATGYGLTLGIHSRIDETIDAIVTRAHVGNIYVNRNIIGAVVGVQPFGGEGKSGTGPKAGGPLYLKRLQRNGSWKLPTDVQAPVLPASFRNLMSWADTHGHGKIADFSKAYARESLVNANLVLPGPTGERNTLHFASRGDVLCAASDLPTLLNQLAAVMVTGNRPVLSAKTAALLPADVPDIVRKVALIVEGDGLRHSPLRMALLDASSMTRSLSVLAERDGALVISMLTNAEEPIPLWRLVAERAVCVNTTAAGGNASLMTLSV